MSPRLNQMPLSPWQFLNCDVHRLLGRSGFGAVVRQLIVSRNFRPLVSLRLCQWLETRGLMARPVLALGRLFHRWFCHLAAIDLAYRTSIGPGLAITHGWSLVIAQQARIGANCTLYHGVTIGRKDDFDADGHRRSGYPVIEDECWIGPNACVIGNVRVGRGSIVGAGAVVVKDVPPASVVVGNPARVIRTADVPDVVNRPPDWLTRSALRQHPVDTDAGHSAR